MNHGGQPLRRAEWPQPVPKGPEIPEDADRVVRAMGRAIAESSHWHRTKSDLDATSEIDHQAKEDELRARECYAGALEELRQALEA